MEQEKLNTQVEQETIETAPKEDVTAETTLSALATISLVCGIIATIISVCFIFDSGFNSIELYLIPISILFGTFLRFSVFCKFSSAPIVFENSFSLNNFMQKLRLQSRFLLKIRKMSRKSRKNQKNSLLHPPTSGFDCRAALRNT